jgi:hypothetical protein
MSSSKVVPIHQVRRAPPAAARSDSLPDLLRALDRAFYRDGRKCRLTPEMHGAWVELLAFCVATHWGMELPCERCDARNRCGAQAEDSPEGRGRSRASGEGKAGQTCASPASSGGGFRHEEEG